MVDNDFLNDTIVDFLNASVDAFPDKEAFIFLKDSNFPELLTYSDLLNRIDIIGSNLALHANKGDRVLLLFQPGLEFVCAIFACFKLGLIAVPAYIPSNERNVPRIINIIKDCDANIVLTETVKQMEQLKSCLLVGRGLSVISTKRLKSKGAFKSNVSSQDLAFLQYTSGSTGEPKGVMVSHNNLISNIHVITQAYALNEKDTVAFWLPHYHDFGLIGAILSTVVAGYTSVLMSPVSFIRKPYRWLKAISDYQATGTGGPNFCFDSCVKKIKDDKKKDLDLSSLRFVINAAEPIRKDTLENFSETFRVCGFDRDVFKPTYGLAEATLYVCSDNKINYRHISREKYEKNIIDDEATSDQCTLIGVGDCFNGFDMAVVDPGSNRRCPPDVVGELWIRGDSVAQGYWKKDELTAEQFRARYHDQNDNSFYFRTGDLACFDAKGNLYVTGRLKDLLIFRGKNVYPQDVEYTSECTHPSLKKNSCVAFTVEKEGDSWLVVVQEVEKRIPENISSVVEEIISNVTSEHEISNFHSLVLVKSGSIEKTSSGKVRRRRTKEQFLDNALQRVYGWENPIFEVNKKDVLSAILDEFSEEEIFSAIEELER